MHKTFVFYFSQNRYIQNDEFNVSNEDNNIKNYDGYKYLSLKCTDKYKEIWNKVICLIRQKDDDDADYDDNN